jgi:hypothetical protein
LLGGTIYQCFEWFELMPDINSEDGGTDGATPCPNQIGKEEIPGECPRLPPANFVFGKGESVGSYGDIDS